MLLKAVRTRLLVEDGQVIPPGAAVARTEIQCKEAGVIRGSRRSRGDSADFGSESDLFTYTVALRVSGFACSWHGLAPGLITEESGMVLEVKRSERPSGAVFPPLPQTQPLRSN